MQHGQTEMYDDDVVCHQYLTKQISVASLRLRRESTSNKSVCLKVGWFVGV